MIKVYSMSVEPLYDESMCKATCDKLDTSRLEKVNGAKRTEDKILRVGAGLLLQYAVQKSPVFEYGPDTISGNEGLQCEQVSVKEILDGIREPIEFDFKYGPHGKPYFNEPRGAETGYNEKGNLFFSLSHSGEYVLCALSDEEIGADIQKIPEAEQKRLEREAQIANKFFTEQERIWCQQQRVRFYRLWVAKEAYIKLTGNGLTQGIDSFTVNLENGDITENIDREKKIAVEKTAKLFEIQAPQGYTAAVSCFVKQDEPK